ncbi:MAG TPA: NUDIX domain-containing protein [Steroidobacteraceae bacterium]
MSAAPELETGTKKLGVEVKERVSLHEGFLRLYRYVFRVEKHRGGFHEVTREIMERGDSVAVLAYDPERNEIVLCNEFRPGIKAAGEYPFGDNLVAGLIGKDESSEDAAIREMREETGLELRAPRVIHRGAYVSSGGTSERIVLVFGLIDASKAGGVHGNSDESEDILTVIVPAPVFVERVQSGAINDLKTLLAGYWFAGRQHRGAGSQSRLPSATPASEAADRD